MDIHAFHQAGNALGVAAAAAHEADAGYFSVFYFKFNGAGTDAVCLINHREIFSFLLLCWHHYSRYPRICKAGIFTGTVIRWEVRRNKRLSRK